MKLNHALLVSATGMALITCTAQAQIGFSDDFDAGTSGSSWTAKLSGADAFADFAFNYGSLGIPSAPHSVGGTTTGMRFLANQSANVQQGISASPNGKSFTGNFRLRFDMWLNYNGPLNGGGSGSTQMGSFGWGTSGASAQWSGSSSSIMFGATADGGAAQDYRVYTNNTFLAPATGVYAAGNTTTPVDARNASHSYYTAHFGGESAPAAQVALYPAQTNVTAAGALGFKWHDVTVDKVGNTITWSIDGTVFATVSTEGTTLSGDNIFFGQFDINSSSSTDANDFLITSIFDNIRVTEVPEPGIAAFGVLGFAAILIRRRS